MERFGMKITETVQTGRVVRVGILGCGMVTQVVHVPLLNNLPHLFQVTHLHDASKDAAKHSQSKVAGSQPKIAATTEDLCNAADVDLVMVATNHAFHAYDAELALKAGKHVFIEKPIALTLHDTDRIIAADKAVGGGKVFIGYMRRYAAAFVDAVKEIGSIGADSTFNDYQQAESEALQKKTSDDITEALNQLDVKVTPETEAMWNMLSILGSHDLSAMREMLGMPMGVIGFSPCDTSSAPFWSAIFQYPGFAVAYESGLDQVPRFDCSIEVFGEHKTVKVVIDTPFVKGLPTTMVVKGSVNGSYRESTIRRTYEDPFLLELLEVYDWVVNGKAPKTNPVDARQDLEILGMLMKAI